MMSETSTVLDTNTVIEIKTVEEFLVVQSILFSLGYYWSTHGNKYLEYENILGVTKPCINPMWVTNKTKFPKGLMSHGSKDYFLGRGKCVRSAKDFIASCKDVPKDDNQGIYF